jgi:peptidoglycan hydrolase-like amidase
MNSEVYALGVYNGLLIAGGYFTTAGGVTAKRIASWNSSNWQALASSMDADVWHLSSS